MRPRIIINPVAGRGRGASAEHAIRRTFAQEQQPFELMITDKPSDALEWSYEACRAGAPYIAGAGGDGTANEIVNGMARWISQGGDPQRLPRLGMIPVGTGNDFGFNFGLASEISEACRRLIRQNSRPMDVGLVESDTEPPLHFVNGVGLGFDAVVNIQSRKIRFLRGGAVYLPAVIMTMLFYYRAPRVAASYNDVHLRDNLMMISVMNGERFGALFYMTPGSHIDDGQLSLCFVRKVPRWQMFALVPRFINGTHPSHPRISLANAGLVSVEAEEALPSHVDGEIYSIHASQYRFSIVPWKVAMIC